MGYLLLRFRVEPLPGSGTSYAVIGYAVSGKSSACSQTTALGRVPKGDLFAARTARCRDVPRILEDFLDFRLCDAVLADVLGPALVIVVKIPPDVVDLRHSAAFMVIDIGRWETCKIIQHIFPPGKLANAAAAALLSPRAVSLAPSQPAGILRVVTALRSPPAFYGAGTKGGHVGQASQPDTKAPSGWKA
jgi:hypothetical protein